MNEDDWLDRRVVGDRWRMLDPFLRARALLEAAADEVRRLDEIRLMRLTDDGAVKPGELDKASLRGDFGRLLDEVQALARGEPQYEVIDGRAHRLGRVWTRQDRRFLAIEQLLEILSRATSRCAHPECRTRAHLDLSNRVDARVRELLLDRREMFEDADRFMASLPSRPIRTVRAIEPSESAPVRYDDTALRRVTMILEGPVQTFAERAALAAALLGVPGDDLEPEPTPPREELPGLRPEAKLIALDQVFEELEGLVLKGATEKARVLSEEFTDADGSEGAYIRRAEELDAELIEPHRTARDSIVPALISAAVNVAPVARWPRGGSMRDRARALAGRVAATMKVGDDELALARLSAGFPRDEDTPDLLEE